VLSTALNGDNARRYSGNLWSKRLSAPIRRPSRRECRSGGSRVLRPLRGVSCDSWRSQIA